VHKFTGRMTSNLDFKGTLLFAVEYLRNDKSETYGYYTEQ